MEEDLKYEIDAAVAALRAGDIILYPTDTVWGHLRAQDVRVGTSIREHLT